MTGHVVVVHDANDERRWAYFSCTCGVCGGPRSTTTRAHRDAQAHHAAVKRAREAGRPWAT